jgi:hypothetical protein
MCVIGMDGRWSFAQAPLIERGEIIRKIGGELRYGTEPGRRGCHQSVRFCSNIQDLPGGSVIRDSYSWRTSVQHHIAAA